MLEMPQPVQAGPWRRRGKLQMHVGTFSTRAAAARAADLAALKIASMSGEPLQEDALNVMHRALSCYCTKCLIDLKLLEDRRIPLISQHRECLSKVGGLAHSANAYNTSLTSTPECSG